MAGLIASSWRPIFARSVFGVAVAAGIMFTPPLASARSAYESPYSYERTWNAALRLVRVDMGLAVTEKDESSGYLLFDYRSPESGKKVTPGSFEIVRGKEADAPVRVIVQLPLMPQYHEQMLVDALSSKMRNDYGDPPPKKKPAPKPAVPEVPSGDAGVEAGGAT